jgi:hypothetical protein
MSTGGGFARPLQADVEALPLESGAQRPIAGSSPSALRRRIRESSHWPGTPLGGSRPEAVLQK